jgi:hypothetical protein
MTLEEMKYKMLVQILENQMVLLTIPDSERDAPDAYNDTSDLLFAIRGAKYETENASPQ